MTSPNFNNLNSKAATKKDLHDATQRIDKIMVGVIVVIAFGFITLCVTAAGFVMDSYRFKTETYQNLVNKVIEQNTKIDTLTNKINQSNLENFPQNTKK